MYSFKLNIGSLTTPVIGGGYIDVTPIYNGTTLKKGRGEDDLLMRKSLNGSLFFFGQDYTALKTLADASELFCDIKIYWGVTNVLTGNLSLLGSYSVAEKTCKLSFVQDDLYNKILAHLDDEFNLTNFNTVLNIDHTSILSQQHQAKEFGGAAAYLPDTDWTDLYYLKNAGVVPAAWLAATDYEPVNVSGVTPDRLFYGEYDCFVLESGKYYACAVLHTSGTFATDLAAGKWVQVGAGINYSREQSDFEFDDSIWYQPEDQWVLASNSTTTHTKAINSKKIFDILNTLLTAIDPSIELYETTSGANTGFCEYTFDNFIEKHYKFIYSFEDEPKISLQEILNIYKTMHNCDWRLEGNIFVFRHPTERPVSLGSGIYYDFTNIFSKDWTVYIEETSIVDNINNETWSFADNVRSDWKTHGFEYDNNFDDSRENTINFETEIKHALVKADGALIMAATLAAHWYINNNTGIVSTETEYNGYLSVSQCVSDHFREGRPFDSGLFSATNVILALTKKRNVEINLKVPMFDTDEIDPKDYLIKTNNGNLEVKEISIKLADGISEIIGIK